MATVLVLTPNTLLDHLADGPFTVGKVNRVPRFTPVAGGKGLNVARVLARHGHHVIACGFAGGDSGQQLIDLVRADGCEPAFTTTTARTRLGFCVTDPTGPASAALESGFAVEPAEVAALAEAVAIRLASVALVIAAGSVPDVTANALYRVILERCAAQGVPCWIDAYGAAMREALTCGHPPLLAKPNREEYAHDRAWRACRELHLTDGAAAIHVRHPEGRWRVTPPTVVERNPIGSGDCYLAALAHGRLSGWPLSEQWRYAAAAGAANAARTDVARIGPADIRPLVDQVVVAPATADEDRP